MFPSTRKMRSKWHFVIWSFVNLYFHKTKFNDNDAKKHTQSNAEAKIIFLSNRLWKSNEIGMLYVCVLDKHMAFAFCKIYKIHI